MATAQARTGSSVTTLNADATISVAVGDLIYVMAFSEASSANTHSFSDSLGNVWAQIANLADPGNARTISHHYCRVTVAGSTLLTMGVGSAQPARFGAVSYTGISGALLDHKEDIFTSDPGTGTDAVAGTVLVPSVQPAWVLGAAEDGYGPTFTQGSGFASDLVPGTWTADGETGLFESKRVTSTSPVSATWTLSATGTGHMAALSAVFGEAALAPVITAQPTQQSAAAGATATFTVTATGATSYQWQRAPITSLYANAPGTWANVSGGSGGTSASYTTPALPSGDNGTWFQCLVTNAGGTTTTLPARLFITGLPLTGKGSAGGMIGGLGGWLFQHNLDRTTRDMLLRKVQGKIIDGTNAAPLIWGDWFWPAAGGSVAYNASMAEAGTLTDVAAAVAAYLSSVAEAPTLTHAQTGVAAFAAAEAESGTLTDANSAIYGSTSAQAEAPTATDAATVTAGFIGAAAEAATATDASAAVAAFASAQAEAVTSTDAAVAVAALQSAVAEAPTLTDASAAAGSAITGAIAEAPTVSDAQAATMAALGAVADALTPTEAATAAASFAAASSDALTATDAQAGVAAFQAVEGEAVTAADAATGTQSSGSNVSVAEAPTITDSAASTAAFAASGSETMTSADATGAAQASASTMAEAVTAADAYTGAAGALSAAIGEAVTATDAVSALLARVAAMAEAGALSELSNAIAAFTAALTEPGLLTDASGAFAAFRAGMAEAVTPADVVATVNSILTDPRFVLRGLVRSYAVIARPRALTVAGRARSYKVTAAARNYTVKALARNYTIASR